ncbi:hypothetical protein PV327_010507 [Microctonus hyperodae]|uniref:MADF domain-containing protein n=1 Tax=Microctonus hyperodae TaxID=165561 RepID=A0AA39KV28_MICHY|nr:hypothetical protein PV327_010507 [Microctonus hyperodae]
MSENNDHEYSVQMLEEIVDDNEYDEAEVDEKGSDELLINAVRSHPNLYDSSLKEYKDAGMKENSWIEVASMLNMPVTTCQTRWLRLRERFSREKRLQEIDARNKDSEASRRPVFPLYNDLMFLEKHVKRRRSYSRKANRFAAKRRAILVPVTSVCLTGLTTNRTHQLISRTNSTTNNFQYQSIENNSKKPHIMFPTPPPLICGNSTNMHSFVSNESTQIPVIPSVSNSEINQYLSKTENKESTNLESSLLILINKLQNYLSNIPARSSDHDSCNQHDLAADRTFGDLIIAELRKFPEAEKKKRQKAILEILYSQDNLDVT